MTGVESVSASVSVEQYEQRNTWKEAREKVNVCSLFFFDSPLPDSFVPSQKKTLSATTGDLLVFFFFVRSFPLNIQTAYRGR